MNEPLITIKDQNRHGSEHYVHVELEGVDGPAITLWAHQDGDVIEFSIHDPNNNEPVYRNTYFIESEAEQEYTVTLTNTFSARSAEDAVGQMATYASDNAYQAGYRVEKPDGSTVFLDADDIDWTELSEKMERL